MYTVIGTVNSRALRVLWMLEELEQPFEHVMAGPRSDDVMAANPSGKVPVLLDEAEAITDSAAILTYLADKHGALSFPPGTIERARQDSLTHFILDEFDAALWTAARHTFILPKERRVPEIKESLKWEFENSQRTLVSRMSHGPFLMGEQMTIADIMLTHCLNWAYVAKFPVTEQPLLDYGKSMRQRPAYKRAMARQE
ncbi:glutathione S-transferase family protein [Actibacterium lipolyticum]|uniref:Glutathione S-transferase GST-6.0 n=1 Tax=Actibacterium lipolyticum TaxID=1524263 RepID=A0A238KWA5_9RHOB|nr:glutathione S-transferase family protein [Actibacterium lipolyticum]SMX46356.1 Glutathione S-transferase GST-6.0 [Actibacterium lipolyticum]